MDSRHPLQARLERGFTIVELLVVMLVILILGSLASSLLPSISNRSRLSEAATMLSEELAYARSLAELENREIEVRFYEYVDPDHPSDSPAFHSFQVLAYEVVTDPSDPDYVPLGTAGFVPPVRGVTAVRRLPEGIVFHDESGESTLLNDASRTSFLAAASITLPDGTPAMAAGFRYRPAGTTDLDLAKDWYVTLVQASDAIGNGGSLPADFATIQIDPFTGTHHVLRPN